MSRKLRGVDELSQSRLSVGSLQPSSTRRRFLKSLSLSAAGLSMASAPFSENEAGGLTPVGPAQTPSLELPGKQGLVVLNERPVNAETPLHFLDSRVTSNAHHFIRNNGLVPERARRRVLDGWTLTLDGELERPATLDLTQLQRLPQTTLELAIECGGNGRAGFQPGASGNQWTLGAIGCASYTGIRLKDLLEAHGVKDSAVFVAYYGEDPHLSGDPKQVPISRGIPISKAVDPYTILAWEMNGEPLPTQHGFPLRLVAPGYPASASGKWLRRLWVRAQIHDGPKMGGYSYRVPRHPVPPGADVPQADMKIIEAMPVKSIITNPLSGLTHHASRPLSVRGKAWSGDSAVSEMHVSTDFGQSWIRAELEAPANAFAWQSWSASVRFPTDGHYELWARATHPNGTMQPMVVPGWNPRGYLNNAMHRIAVTVEA